jgi:hypothetical protein
MTSLARGLAVLRALSTGGSFTIAELSRIVGFPRAAVRRCLHTLEVLGYVGSNRRTFFVTAKVLSLMQPPPPARERGTRSTRRPRTGVDAAFPFDVGGSARR